MFGKKQSNKTGRFLVKEEFLQPLSTGVFEYRIIVDTVTGINYIQPLVGTTFGGLTPLLDSNGKIVIDSSYISE